METKKSIAYLRAKRKVETLKAFYSHLIVFVVINLALILFLANVFGSGPVDFSAWSIYITLFLWGIGLVSHAIYVFFVLNKNNNFLKRWEDRKIQEFLERDI